MCYKFGTGSLFDQKETRSQIDQKKTRSLLLKKKINDKIQLKECVEKIKKIIGTNKTQIARIIRISRIVIERIWNT